VPAGADIFASIRVTTGGLKYMTVVALSAGSLTGHPEWQWRP
jgi:hypothetical protein